MSPDDLKRIEAGKVFKLTRNQDTYKLFSPSFSTNTLYTNNLTLYVSLLPVSIANEMIPILRSLNLGLCNTNDEYLSLLGMISEMAKVLGTQFSNNWRFYHGLHSMFEYYKTVPQTEMRDKIQEWLVDEVSLHIDGDEDKWHAYFDEELQKVIETEFDHGMCVNMSANQYLNDYLWVKGKGTDIDSGFIREPGGNIRRTRRSKNSASFRHTVSELKHHLFTVTPQVLRPFQKPEVGKIRSIVAGDFSNFMKMDYLSTYLESGFANHPYMCIFYSNQQRRELNINMIQLASEENYLKVPLDQSKFDHMVTRRMVISCFNKLATLLPKGGDHNAVMQALICGMFSTKSVVTDDRGNLPYVKGIASGWRWTALLDTLVNYVEFRVIKRLFNERRPDPATHLNVINMQFQGDDARLVMDNTIDQLSELVSLYGECGLKVNKQKNFIASNRDEFLKMVAENNALVGYPARTIPSLTQFKPTSDAPLNFSDRMYDITNNAFRAIRRGLDHNKVMCHVKSLLYNKIDWEAYRHWVMTPTSLGGYGCHDDVMAQTLGVSNDDPYVVLESTLLEYENHVESPILEQQYNNLNHLIESSVLHNSSISMMPYRDRGIKLVRRSHLARVHQFATKRGGLRTGLTHIQAIPHWREMHGYHPAIKSSLRDTAIRRLDEDTLRTLLEYTSYCHYVELRNKGVTKTVLREWLTGNVTVPSVQSIHFDPAQCIDYRQECEQLLCVNALRVNATINTLLNTRLAVEHHLYNRVINDITTTGIRILL